MQPLRALALASLLATTSFAAMPAGDELWDKRAEGARGAKASVEPIDATIASYRAELVKQPNDLETRWKLLRALRFRGVYATDGVDEKKRIFDAAKQIGNEGVAILDRMLKTNGEEPVADGKEANLAEALRDVPGAGQLLYWDAANWGEWALVFGKLAAVRQGAAERIRRQSTIVMLMDPDIEHGGGARILGRLHHQTPRVPFITGWASDRKAVEFLEQSVERGPDIAITKVFLAEALASYDKKQRARATEMLRELVASPVDPLHQVEEEAAREDARRVLAEWGEE